MTQHIGVDCACDSRSALAPLKHDGFAFVGRYYAITTDLVGKILEPAEAKAISDAGLDVVSIWENGRADTPEYWTAANGGRDASYAAQRAMSAGQPHETPIYIAVDLDVGPDLLANGVMPYVDAWHTYWENNDVPFAVGVYGSGYVCTAMLAHRLAANFWLASARGWKDTSTFTQWHIAQGKQEVLYGLTFDRNVARDGYGGWRVIGAC